MKHETLWMQQLTFLVHLSSVKIISEKWGISDVSQYAEFFFVSDYQYDEKTFYLKFFLMNWSFVLIVYRIWN